MGFSREFIERVQESSDLVGVVSQHTVLKSMGSRLFGCCPLPGHSEKTPSFSVSKEKQLYYCFGCKQNGNVFTFVQAMTGMSFPEVVEYLAKQAGIPIEREENSGNEKHQKHQALIQVNRAAANFFTSEFLALPADHPVKLYAQKRGLTKDSIDKFHLGYAPNKWDGLLNFLQQKKVAIELARELGLVKPNQQNSYFDIFRHRLMFPILSTMGDPIGFGGRVLDEQNNPKYLNSSESLLFEKGKTLYGLHETAKFIRSEDRAIIVEGYMDLLALYGVGITNVAAVLGTAFTEHHARLLARYTRKVTVLFDGDEAGQKAMVRSLPILLKGGLFPCGLILPDGLDPDDFVRKFGAQQLKEALAQAPDLFDLVLANFVHGFRGSATEKVVLVEKLAPIFAAVANSALKALYLQKCAEKLRVSEKWLKEALAGSKEAPQASSRPNSATANVGTEIAMVLRDRPIELSLGELHPEERCLLQLALHRVENHAVVIESGVLEFVANSGMKEIFGRMTDVSRQEPHKFATLGSLLTSFVDKSEILMLPPEMVDLKPEQQLKFIKDCARKIKQRFFEEQALQIQKQGKEQGLSEQEILARIMAAQRSRLLTEEKAN